VVGVLTTFLFGGASLSPALAAGSNMPWEQPLQQILQSIEGPVSKIIAIITISVSGLTLAFGDTAGRFRRLIQIVFGLSIAFAASSFFLLGGGALIWRRSANLMARESIDGLEAPVHRALTEPILLAVPPSAVAIVNGTLSAATGLGFRLAIAGIILRAFGHMAGVWAAADAFYAACLANGFSPHTGTLSQAGSNSAAHKATNLSVQQFRSWPANASGAGLGCAMFSVFVITPILTWVLVAAGGYLLMI
jgi:type IV secretion system protein VirB2